MNGYLLTAALLIAIVLGVLIIIRGAITVDSAKAKEALAAAGTKASAAVGNFGRWAGGLFKKEPK